MVHNRNRKKVQLDALRGPVGVKNPAAGSEFFDISAASRNSEHDSVLIFRGRRSSHFFTEDSRRYLTPREEALLAQGLRLNREADSFDNVSARVIRDYRTLRQDGRLLTLLAERYAKAREDFSDGSRIFFGQFTMTRLWNMSIVGAILLGMFSMTLIYRYLGNSANAAEAAARAQADRIATERVVENAGVMNQAGQADGMPSADDLERLTSVMRDLEEVKKDEFEAKILKMVKGYPIEDMVPYIAEKDPTVAAFMIAIAKIESNWGKRVPVLNGQDCFNYVGYRGIRERMGSGGHTCFDNRRDAVDTVAKRLETLIKKNNLDSANDLIIWKCGSSCAGHSQKSVDNWIGVVGRYFNDLREK